MLVAAYGLSEKRTAIAALAESAAPWRAVLRTLSAPGRALPWAIEYPLAGDDLLAVTREQVARIRSLEHAP